MRNMVGPLASSTHEAPSLRESAEQDQPQENEPLVYTAAANAHRLYRYQISSESKQTSRWTQSLTGDSQGFSEKTWYRKSEVLSQILGQGPSLASVEQDWKHQGLKHSDFRPPV